MHGYRRGCRSAWRGCARRHALIFFDISDSRFMAVEFRFTCFVHATIDFCLLCLFCLFNIRGDWQCFGFLCRYCCWRFRCNVDYRCCRFFGLHRCRFRGSRWNGRNSIDSIWLLWFFEHLMQEEDGCKKDRNRNEIKEDRLKTVGSV